LSVLREAGLVESMQSRGDNGHFQAGCYRLAVAEDVIARVPLDQLAAAGPSRRRVRSVAGRSVALASEAGAVVEQLVLLPSE
jgi:hypothetical protein